jgi:cadmium resistance protein CadD (predicted permease)
VLAYDFMETDLPSILAIGIAVYVSTDVDDLLMLIALFADPAFNWRAIVIGQFMGIAMLVLASSLIALSAVRVSSEHTALLGMGPLAFGLWRIWGLWNPQHRRDIESRAPGACLVESRTALQVITVTVLTMANGGDNLVAYVPLFAAAPKRIPIYSAEFAVLTAVWCVFAYLCVNNRIVHVQARRFGHAALPFAMVLLGLWILSGIRGRAP